MKVFNQDKTQELKEYNLSSGHLKQDRLITHIDSVIEQKEQGHYETIREYPNGGKDVKWVIDVPLTDTEKERMKESADTLKKVMTEAGLYD